MPYSKNSSGRYCSVFGCKNSNKLLFQWREEVCIEDGHLGLLHKDCACVVPYNFRLFPKDSDLRQEWIRKINRKSFTPGKYAVYRPRRRRLQREPLAAMEKINSNFPGLTSVHKEEVGELNETSLEHQIRVISSGNKESSDQPLEMSFDLTNNDNLPTKLVAEKELYDYHPSRIQVQLVNKSTQWDLTDIYPDHTYAAKQPSIILLSKTPTNSCGTQTQIPSITNKLLVDNDYKFYTSLPMIVFLCLVTTLGGVIKTPFKKLSVHDQLLLVFCRLRLGLLFGDLGRRFSVSKSHASRIFTFWMPRMAAQMQNLIVWLPRETIRRSMPDCFKMKYPFTTCIIDCAEVILDRARSHWMRAVTYSNYKGRNTIKFLIAIAPNGSIMFVSDCFGGRASDQFITQHSGFLNYLLPGDEIMADRGFLIEDILPPGTKLNVPPFTRGKLQLPETEVTQGRRIASVRVHVERVIAQLKKYRVLKTNFPLKQNKLADSIIIVCAAMCNLQKSVVPKSNVDLIKLNKKA